MTHQASLRILAPLALILALTAPAVMAQTTPATSSDGRWSPWLGCWRLSHENIRENNLPTLTALAQPSTSRGTATPGILVCVKPSGAAGVTMTTFADGQIVLEQAVVADGAAHPIADVGCQGTQRSEWSHDGRRLFTTVDVACDNRRAQTVSGMTLFGKGPAWLDIQSIKADGDQHVRIRRYEATSERPAGAPDLPPAAVARARSEAQAAGARPLVLDDVVEASAKVASPAVEAALVETGSRFTLNSNTLERLADAHVSPNVIDLMVAQSFPKQFRVDRNASMSTGPMTVTTTPLIAPPVFGNFGYPPYATTPYNPYDPYIYYYSPFAYPYYWGTTQYFINSGPRVINGSGSEGGGTTSLQGGQVVNGRGYTRVRPAGTSSAGTQAVPAQHTAGGGQAVRATGGTTDASSASSGSSSTSSGSGGSSGGVSSSGYSSGASGDSGRTAQPRKE